MSVMQRAARRLFAPRPDPSQLTARDHAVIRKMAPFTAGRTRVAGHSIRFSDRDGLLHSITEIFRDEVYRFNAATETPHIIDAGANIGLSVLYFKQLYPKATVVAYEPDQKIFEMLSENMANVAGVDLRQAAAWINNDTLEFFSEGSLAGSASMDFLGKQNVVKVRAERLRDEILKNHVDFLKIDIEGAENEVLFDIADTLDNVDYLFFEYHSVPGQRQRLGDLLNIVERAGFRFSLNGTHGPRLPFIEKVPHGFDLQMNVLCFRPDKANQS